MNQEALDSLSRALCAFEGDRVVVRFMDLVAEVVVDTFIHADEVEEEQASWIVLIEKIVDAPPDSPYHEGGIMELSVVHPPLRVETIAGELLWERP